MVVRLGAQVPIPGIDPEALRQTMESLNDTFFGLFNMFTGGAFGQAAVFGLGIMPYISVSIVVQILQTTLPYFQRLAQEGESGRAKINQMIRYGTVILAFVQSIGIAFLLESYGIVLDPGFAFRFTASILVTGCVFAMWLGEKITDKGIGNGISLLIMVGIIATLPLSFAQEFAARVTENNGGLMMILIEMILWVVVILLSILLVLAVRQIPVQYARRTSGSNTSSAPVGNRQYIPLRLNASGVMPIIFAQALMFAPAYLGGLMGEDSAVGGWMETNFQDIFGLWYNVVFALLIIIFTYFYTAITVPTNKMADDLKQQGGFVPGVKPGKKTAQFIENILTRVTLPGACFLGFIALMPYFLQQLVGLDYSYASFFGGTSLLIIVGVGLDTLSQVETHLLSRHYDGFLSKGKVRGRR